jgi:hypothetical protein
MLPISKKGLGYGRIRNIIPPMLHFNVLPVIIFSPVDASPESKSTASEAEVPGKKRGNDLKKKETQLH